MKYLKSWDKTEKINQILLQQKEINQSYKRMLALYLEHNFYKVLHTSDHVV